MPNLISSVSRRTETYDLRTSINGLYSKTGKHANLNPGDPFEPGDYGKIDRDTGKFDHVGKIFRDERTIELAAALEVKTGAVGGLQVIVTGNVTNVEIDNGWMSSVAEATMSGQFKFTASYGALLMMHKQIPSSLVQKEPGRLLRANQYQQLRDMHTVTEVVRCSAYALYLSGGKCETVKIAFDENGPAPGFQG